jgi:hypothetical protein
MYEADKIRHESNIRKYRENGRYKYLEDLNEYRVDKDIYDEAKQSYIDEGDEYNGRIESYTKLANKMIDSITLYKATLDENNKRFAPYRVTMDGIPEKIKKIESYFKEIERLYVGTGIMYFAGQDPKLYEQKKKCENYEQDYNRLKQAFRQLDQEIRENEVDNNQLLVKSKKELEANLKHLNS